MSSVLKERFFYKGEALKISDVEAKTTPTSLNQQPNKVKLIMSEQIRYVTDSTFAADVLQAPLPVLLDYWAEWCGPCRSIAPILEEIAKEYAGRITVAKMNVDENQETPQQYNVRGIPTLMLFKNGNIEATKVGALSKSQLIAFVDSHI